MWEISKSLYCCNQSVFVSVLWSDSGCWSWSAVILRRCHWDRWLLPLQPGVQLAPERRIPEELVLQSVREPARYRTVQQLKNAYDDKSVRKLKGRLRKIICNELVIKSVLHQTYLFVFVTFYIYLKGILSAGSRILYLFLELINVFCPVIFAGSVCETNACCFLQTGGGTMEQSSMDQTLCVCTRSQPSWWSSAPARWRTRTGVLVATRCSQFVKLSMEHDTNTNALMCKWLRQLSSGCPEELK